ncbi:MAG: hypothetical protein DLM73_00700 [Chthoniobacterales bacterium]|nr:MAG: hypothetical protein DLM73_00700 [Chthoniobacterales bacterium]
MKALLRDLRYSARLLAKSPTFTIAVVLSLAIGIGANAAIFSLMNGVMLKPLPFKESERLVTLWEKPKLRFVFADTSGPNYRDWKEQSGLFESLSAFTNRKEATLSGNGDAERVATSRVTGDFFATLRVRPALGRWFVDDELAADQPNVAVISDALWKRHFAARPDVIGTEITLDRAVYRIVGVSPPIFEPLGYPPVEVVLPLNLNTKEMTMREMHLLSVIGRLKFGVTISAAQVQMDVIAARLAEQYPNVNGTPEINVMTPRGLGVVWYRSLLLMLQGAVLFVLLIACTNVASLLLARWTGRQQELAIRAALGATRWSMLRLSLCESILLVACGSLLGIWLADVFRRAILSVEPGIPRMSEVQIDANVLCAIIGLSACLALFFALVPLLFSRGIEINDWLRQGSRSGGAGPGRQRLRGFLIALQVLLTVVLLSGAGLLVRSLWRLQKTDLGFQPENLLSFHLFPDNSRYGTPEAIAAFYTTVFERLNAIPGIGETSAVSHLPFSRGGMGNRVALPGRMRNPGEQFDAQTVLVTPEYFRSVGLKFVSGRPFTAGDAQGAPPVILINETLARHLSPSENPLGKQLEIEGARWRPDADSVQPRTAEIVGVVGDSKQWGVTEPAHDVVYVPFAQNPAPSMFIVTKPRIQSATLVESIRAAIAALDPDQPVYDVQMMTERIRASEPDRRFNATLLILFAVLALVATAIGIYGTLAFWVAQRTHEIGVRMALGADTRRIISLVVRKIGTLMFVGLALGLPASFALVRVIRSVLSHGQPAADMFYGVNSFDPMTMLAVLAVLIGSATVATLIPAWRATRIDPARVLQTE